MSTDARLAFDPDPEDGLEVYLGEFSELDGQDIAGGHDCDSAREPAFNESRNSGFEPCEGRIEMSDKKRKVVQKRQEQAKVENKTDALDEKWWKGSWENYEIKLLVVLQGENEQRCLPARPKKRLIPNRPSQARPTKLLSFVISNKASFPCPRTYHDSGMHYRPILTPSARSLRVQILSLSRLASTAPASKPQQPKAKSTHQPGGQGDRLSVLPFILIFFAGTGSYLWLVKSRAKQAQGPVSGETKKTGRYQR